MTMKDVNVAGFLGVIKTEIDEAISGAIKDRLNGDCFIASLVELLGIYTVMKHCIGLDEEKEKDKDKLASLAPMRLVHGLVTSQDEDAEGNPGPMFAMRHVHAWLETTIEEMTGEYIRPEPIENSKQWLVMDVSGKGKVIATREAYYEAGSIDPENTVTYTAHDAMRLLEKHHTVGPWDKQLAELQNASLEELKKRCRENEDLFRVPVLHAIMEKHGGGMSEKGKKLAEEARNKTIDLYFERELIDTENLEERE